MSWEESWNIAKVVIGLCGLFLICVAVFSVRIKMHNKNRKKCKRRV